MTHHGNRLEHSHASSSMFKPDLNLLQLWNVFFLIRQQWFSSLLTPTNLLRIQNLT